MQPSLHALLEDAIDYAGTFPPAQLSLEQAVRNYARYQKDSAQWLLGRFIYPAAQLHELDAYSNYLQTDCPFAISTVGRSGAEEAAWLAGIRADVEAVEAFQQRQRHRVVINVYETKLPPRPAPTSSWKEFLLQGWRRLEPWTDGVMPFFEYGLEGEYRSSLPPLLAALAETATVVGQPLGFKLRCGGLDAKAFPSIEAVAFVLGACRDAGVPLKCTAGLHHPLRRFDTGLGTFMHGFVNVLLAGVLAQARQLDEESLRAVLAEEAGERFVFTAAGCRWRELEVSTDEIRRARQTGVISFGSCSFEEPRDDLRALGWL